LRSGIVLKRLIGNHTRTIIAISFLLQIICHLQTISIYGHPGGDYPGAGILCPVSRSYYLCIVHIVPCFCSIDVVYLRK